MGRISKKKFKKARKQKGNEKFWFKSFQVRDKKKEIFLNFLGRPGEAVESSKLFKRFSHAL